MRMEFGARYLYKHTTSLVTRILAGREKGSTAYCTQALKLDPMADWQSYMLYGVILRTRKNVIVYSEPSP